MVYFDVKHQYDPNEFIQKNEDEIEITEVKIEPSETEPISGENSIVLGDIQENNINKSAVSELKRDDKSFRSLSSNTKNDVKLIMHDRIYRLI
jgi:hypothetical protein